MKWQKRKEKRSMSVVTGKKARVSNVIDVEKRFNSLGKLLNVTAWVRRFICNLKQKVERKEMKDGGLQFEEIIEAEKLWIQDAQIALKEEKNYEKLKDSLGIIEKDGVLACQGRLQHSDLHGDSKYPIALSKEHKLAQRIILECHKRVNHRKVRTTLSELRSKFWISKGRQFVKKVLKQCFRCWYIDCKPFNDPPIAALPGVRATEALPFSTTGVDFAGPLFVKT